MPDKGGTAANSKVIRNGKPEAFRTSGGKPPQSPHSLK
jgi:hypothetical protein